jgi:hypothetical protein
MDWAMKKGWQGIHPSFGRRAFLKIGAAGWASLMSGCRLQENRLRRVSSRSTLLKGEREWAHSICTLCPSGCATRAYWEGGRIVAVAGDPDDPNTGGKMCPIGLSGLNLHYNPDRLTHAYRRTADTMVPVPSEEIMAYIAGQVRGGKALHICGRITPFMSGIAKFLDAACHPDPPADGMPAWSDFLNTDGRPPISDFENARIALLFDSNILEHGYPFVGYVRRITEARSRGMRLVTLSPFLTNTATAGDWVPVRSRAATSMAALAIVQTAMKDPNLHLPMPAAGIPELLHFPDATFLENASGLSHETVQMLARSFFSEPGPAISDQPDPSVLLLNLMKGNLNRPGGLLHPGKRTMRAEEASGDISNILRDPGNIVLLHQANPAFSQYLNVRPVLRSKERAAVGCLDCFMSETAELSDFVLPLASSLETLSVTEPLPLGRPYIAAAFPAIKPRPECRSFDDWIASLATTIHGAAPPLTPERFASEMIFKASSLRLSADRAIYPVSSDPKPFEVRIPSILSSLGMWIVRLPMFSALQPRQHFLTVFEESVQGPGTAPSKWLDEISYSPKIYMNPQRAGSLGIQDGERVILMDIDGREVDGTVLLFEGIHPDALAVPMHHGHTGYGRVACGKRFVDSDDPDMARIFWGKNRGLNPAEIREDIVTIRKWGTSHAL